MTVGGRVLGVFRFVFGSEDFEGFAAGCDVEVAVHVEVGAGVGGLAEVPVGDGRTRSVAANWFRCRASARTTRAGHGSGGQFGGVAGADGQALAAGADDDAGNEGGGGGCLAPVQGGG